MSYILVEAVDENGILCPLADNKIEIKLHGAAQIAGIGNGNPQSMNLLLSNSVNLFYGKAMLILKSGYSKDNVVITATSESLKNAKVTVKVNLNSKV